MEMKELFYKDPYCKEFHTTVKTCQETKDGYEIELNDTAFYPEGGGQPNDLGTLNNIPVMYVKRVNDTVIHVTKEPLQPGTPVHGILDWQRRFDYMQNHSGEHIVSGLIHKHFGYDNVGFHMADQILLDFDGTLTWPDLEKIEQEANDLVQQNEEIQIIFPSDEELSKLPYRSKKELTGKIRIVTIPNADICACCGTHVRRTGEIGLIHILSLQKHKNGSRIEIKCGNRALQDYQNKDLQNRDIVRMLCVKPKEVSTGVANLQKQQEELLVQLHTWQEKDLRSMFTEAPIIFTEGVDRNLARKCANEAVEKWHTCAALDKNAHGYAYVIVSTAVNLKEAGKAWNQALHGKGGGSSDLIMGNVASTPEEIQQTFHSLFGGKHVSD